MTLEEQEKMAQTRHAIVMVASCVVAINSVIWRLIPPNGAAGHQEAFDAVEQVAKRTEEMLKSLEKMAK